MNPKDMTGRALFIASKDSYSSKKQHAGISLLNWIKDQEAIELELLRRLDESDVLRKENEELRDALIDARSWMDAGMFEDVPPQYTAMVANVDAMLSKESEVSRVATKN